MERVLSVEEKIKRAEEIYARRNASNCKNRIETTVPVNKKKNLKLLKKLFVQLLICSLIYCIFYLIYDTKYIFSEDVINKTNEILSYDVNFNSIYHDVMTYIINTTKSNDKENNEEIIVEQEKEQEGESYKEETLSASDIVVQDTGNSEEIKSQMEIDAEYILKNYSVIKPIDGVVTSEFGERESTNPIITPNHIGIDIAANSGASVQASMDGKVTVASYNSSYGNFLKIENGDVMTVYAHCQSLKVKENDEIKKGQIIALVGSTGNSTGPHLHFEIRREDRFINPRYVVDFG